MDEKRKIILKEIEYWKKNKVLPRHYCDFLTALYTEGSEENSIKLSSKLKVNLPYLLFAVSILLAAGMIFFLGYYFTEFSLPLQIALFCFIVFVVGAVLKWFYIQFFSLFLLIFFLAWSTHSYFEENFTWALFEGSWLGASLLLLFSAWMVRQMNIQLSLNLFIHGLILLFVPVIQGMFLSKVEMNILLLILFSKLIFMALFLYINKRMLDVYIRVFSS